MPEFLHSLPKNVTIGLIQLYRWTLSPLLGHACRFEPSCAAYAQEALRRHGFLRGTVLAVKRLGRCHPWGGWGFDPVPPCDRSSHRQKISP